MNREEFIRKMKIRQDTNWALYHQTLEAGLKAHDWTEQSLIIMEELAELSQAVSKGARGDLDRYNLIEEMADVIACFDFLQKHYKITDDELEKALTIKTKYQAKKLGLIEEAEDSVQSLNAAMTKRWGTETPEAPGCVDLMSYEFNIGDIVITTDGGVGEIVDICKCDACKTRGFYELIWVEENEPGQQWITLYDAKNGFKDYHQIGKYIFNKLEKKPEVEYPSENAMVNSLRVFCGDRMSCICCPLHKEFCWGEDILTRRLAVCKVSTADLYRMYRKAFLEGGK